MSPAEITVINPEKVESWTANDPGMQVSQYIKAEPTIVDFQYLDYTQTDVSKVNEGCGELVYSADFATSGFKSNVIRKPNDWDQNKAKRFEIYANIESSIGNYRLTFEVQSAEMNLEPHFYYVVEIKILPCYVTGLDIKGQ